MNANFPVAESKEAPLANVPLSEVAKVVFAIAILGAVGIAIKAPWGVQLMTVAGHPPHPHPDHEWYMWFVATEWGRLFLTVVLGTLFYRYVDFHPAPALERRFFTTGTKPPGRIVRPAILIALVLTVLTGAGIFFGKPPKLATDLVSGVVPHSEAMKTLMLWPLGFVGAGLSEEVLYRFGMIVPIAGAIAFVFGRQRPRVGLIAFWIANIVQAFVFGLGHVQQGVVASNSGGLLLSTLLAAQTWVGLLLGYVFRRWGLLCAILVHAFIDFLVPGLFILWAMWSL